ncbi:hypothetical protein C6495_07495 [Candidatus Poribacteria bacterium]|nr:MAG: hypothetical protein C6495_07495 [Candidatus Poribacteria bacterium]
MEKDKYMLAKRMPVFSFMQRTFLADLIFFLGLIASYTYMVGEYELAKGRENSVETIIAIVGHVGDFISVALVLTLFFELGGSVLMILWNLYKREQEKRLREIATEVAMEVAAEITEKVTAERDRVWTEWNTRRMAAEASGIPFHEPPPTSPQVSPE